MDGHAKLAALMGAHPEVAILRRFGALSMQNLLYLQAELVALEKDLRVAAADDNLSPDPDRARFHRDWYSLSHCRGANDDERSGKECVNELAGKQWRIVLRIREKLAEYNAALAHQSVVAKMPKPNPSDLAFLQQWMKRPSMGNVYLVGQDSDTWSNQEFEPDLLALVARHNSTPFSTWVNNTLVQWYHQTLGRYFREPDDREWLANTVEYSQAGITRLTSSVAAVLASVLPVAGIVILYSIKSDLFRLLVIAVFTAAFSGSLCLVTNANSVEVFMATAAFTAVQVVFVGTNGCPNGNNN